MFAECMIPVLHRSWRLAKFSKLEAKLGVHHMTSVKSARPQCSYTLQKVYNRGQEGFGFDSNLKVYGFGSGGSGLTSRPTLLWAILLQAASSSC